MRYSSTTSKPHYKWFSNDRVHDDSHLLAIADSEIIIFNFQTVSFNLSLVRNFFTSNWSKKLKLNDVIWIIWCKSDRTKKELVSVARNDLKVSMKIGWFIICERHWKTFWMTWLEKSVLILLLQIADYPAVHLFIVIDHRCYESLIFQCKNYDSCLCKVSGV